MYISASKSIYILGHRVFRLTTHPRIILINFIKRYRSENLIDSQLPAHPLINRDFPAVRTILEHVRI